MALKVHRVVVVGCPRCVLTCTTGGSEKQGVGKSCFCNRFVRPDNFKLQHTSRISEETWRENAAYNGDHFLYWGAATKRGADGSKTRFQVVEQTEFFDLDDRGTIVSHRSEVDYVSRATDAHFISRGKVAYKLHEEEEYAIPSSLRSNPMRARAVQLFPNNEFSEGKGVSGFICLFDPTLEGEDIKIQFDFLTNLINHLLKTKRKIVVACTKCDEVNDARIQFGANLVANVKSKKPIPFIETSAKEGVNVEEAFLYVVGNYQKKKKILYKSGKNSPVILGQTFSEVIKSRGKDQAFARTSLNRLIRERVNTFSTEWSSVYPYFQLDPNCHKAVDLIGLDEAKKLFCQRLMELKVLEVKEKYRQRHKSQEDQSRNYQTEILEAFSTHPDLIESAYELVYTPSVSSRTTPVTIPCSQSPTSPRSTSLTPSHTPNSLPPDPINSPTHMSTNLSVSLSPPPPPINGIPPVCVDPAEVTRYRTPVFSPTSTCLSVNSLAAKQLNRSTELLATFPRVTIGLQRHSSLHYKNRTLPPLPTTTTTTTENPLHMLLPAALAKSQPELDEGSEDQSDNGPFEMRRRLSSSMDCLQSSSTIEEYHDGDSIVDLEASPYLQPVQVKMALGRHSINEPPPAVTSSMRVPRHRHYPSLPDGFLTLGKNHRYEKSHSFREKSTKPPPGSNPSEQTAPSKTRSNSSPPPPPSSLCLRSSSPLLINPSTLSPNDKSSLDIGSPSQRACSILSGTDDSSSVISGPFAEVDPLPPLLSEIMKSNESLSRVSNGRVSLQSSASVAQMLDDQQQQHYSSESSKSDGIYARIPADGDEEEEYLKMNRGVSLEDLISSTKGRSSSVPHTQSVIKKLHFVTHRSTETNTTGLLGSARSSVSPLGTPSRSPVRDKRESTGSAKSFHSLRTSIDSSVDVLSPYSRSASKSGLGSNNINRRPLPQSPMKLRKIATIHGHLEHTASGKRRGSFNDGNIYESIDGDHTADWLKQLKHTISRQQRISLEEMANNQQCNQILEHFLSTPEVQELWKSSVMSVYPDFSFSEDFLSVPPLLINPDYFTLSPDDEKSPESSESEKPSEVFDGETHPDEERRVEVSQSATLNKDLLADELPKHERLSNTDIFSAGHTPLGQQESLTDRVLAELNRRLLQQQDSSSGESESDNEYSDASNSDDDEEEEEDGNNNSMDGTSTLNNHGSMSLSTIHEQFPLMNEDDLVMSGETLDRRELTMFTSVDKEETAMEKEEEESHHITGPTHLMNKYECDWLNGPKSHAVVVSVGQSSDDDEEQSDSSSTPDTPSPGNRLLYPTQLKSGNHLTISHVNSLDSGISANGNNGVDD